MKRIGLFVLVIGLLAAGRLLEGQRFGRGGRERRNPVPAPSTTLESITSLTCSFTTAVAAAWEDGEPKVQTKRGAPVTLTIGRIDVQDGSAEIGGGFRGGDHVIVKLAGSTLHFLDIALNGTLGVVTVFAKETSGGRLQAMYSRAAYQPAYGGTIEPEMAQYYGDCEPRR